MTKTQLSLDERVNLEPAEFARSITPEEKMVITLQKEIYGSWQAMKDDLRDRLSKRPYLFLLMERIKQDIEVMDKLKCYEEKRKVDLYALINPNN